MSSISILCDSIFNNTHPELLSLHQQVEEFQTIYQSDVEAISNNLIEQYSYNQEELDESIISDESNLNEPILNNEQIDKFKKIYYKNKIEDNEICCKEICLQNLVFHEHAILTYQKFQNLSNNEKDLFLFGILSATTRQETTTTGQKQWDLLQEAKANIPRRKEALIKKLRKMRTKTDLPYRPSSLEE
ncbi:6499_t:CDS:2, partial [Gigaspora rosea]